MKAIPLLYSWDYHAQKLTACVSSNQATIIIGKQADSGLYLVQPAEYNNAPTSCAHKALTLFFFALRHTNIQHKVLYYQHVQKDSSAYNREFFNLELDADAFHKVLKRFT